MRQTTAWLERDRGEGGGNVAPTAPARPGEEDGEMSERGVGGRLSAGPLPAIGGLVLILIGVLALHEVASLVLPVLTGLFVALGLGSFVFGVGRLLVSLV